MDPQVQIPLSNQIQPENVKFGGAWSRFWAHFVDNVLCGFFIFLFFDYLYFIKGEKISLDQFAATYFYLGWVYIGVYILYSIFLTFSKGATLGKDAYGLKVVQNSSHTPLSLPQTIIRELSKNISFVPFVGWFFNIVNSLMIIFSKEKRGIHDHIAKTQVLKVKDAWPILKQLLLVAILLILLVPVGIAEVLTPSNPGVEKVEISPQTNQSSDSSSVTEWETFTSSSYKYSVAYPKNWTAFKGKDIDAVDKEKSISMADFNNKDCCWIVIEILDQSWQDIESSPPWISSPTPITLAGASGIEGKQTMNNTLKVAKYFYLQHPTLPGKVVSIRVEGNNEEVLNSVLATLKFD